MALRRKQVSLLTIKFQDGSITCMDPTRSRIQACLVKPDPAQVYWIFFYPESDLTQ